MMEFILGFTTSLIACITMILLKRIPRKRKLYSFEPDYVVRPSETILETMKAHGVTTHDLWKRTDLMMEDIAIMLADEELINMDVSTELSKVIGSEPAFWVNLSKNYHDKKEGKMPNDKAKGDGKVIEIPLTMPEVMLTNGQRGSFHADEISVISPAEVVVPIQLKGTVRPGSNESWFEIFTPNGGWATIGYNEVDPATAAMVRGLIEKHEGDAK